MYHLSTEVKSEYHSTTGKEPFHTHFKDASRVILIAEDQTVTVKCRTAKKRCSFKLICVICKKKKKRKKSAMLECLSCSFTYIFFLTKSTIAGPMDACS